MPEPFPTCIDARTRCCAVLGHPVRHSASPEMQNAGMASLGLNWRYLAFEVRPEGLQSAIEGAKQLGFVGLNLTIPHKQAALGFLDKIDARAARWGAANTIRFEARSGAGDWAPVESVAGQPDEVRSVGFNTDGDAIVRVLEQDLNLRLEGSRILLLGAGGAGRVAAMRLAEARPAELFLVNRTNERAEELAAEIRNQLPEAKIVVGYPKGEVDAVVNSTSLGLKEGDPSPFDAAQFSMDRARTAFDMVYGQKPTAFQAVASAAGCKVVDGLGMLLYQGAAALEIWTGRPAPLEAMREALWRKAGRNPALPKT